VNKPSTWAFLPLWSKTGVNIVFFPEFSRSVKKTCQHGKSCWAKNTRIKSFHPIPTLPCPVRENKKYNDHWDNFLKTPIFAFLFKKLISTYFCKQTGYIQSPAMKNKCL
jgi:hypothetical protein